MNLLLPSHGLRSSLQGALVRTLALSSFSGERKNLALSARLTLLDRNLCVELVLSCLPGGSGVYGILILSPHISLVERQLKNASLVPAHIFCFASIF